MKFHHFKQEQFLPVTRARAWEFFSRPANLERLTPPEMGFETVHQDAETIYQGQIIVHRVRLLPSVRVRWISEIREIDEGCRFVDEQRAGPFKAWRHDHRLEDVAGGVLVKDSIQYALPFRAISDLFHPWFVRPKLEKSFRFRRERLAEIFTSPEFGLVPSRSPEPPQ